MSLKFLTYNIDGLNPAAITYRTNTILSLILSENPDVVQLQEVVADTAASIIKTLTKNGYTSFHESDRPSNLCHYFTLSFARTDQIQNPIIRRIPYSGAARSEQGRDILQLNLTFMGQQWMFINCHLESCGVAFKSAGSAIRMAQLREGLERITAHANVGPAILAGDLNIRDPEAVKIMADYTHAVLDASIELEQGRKTNTWYMPAPSKYSARYDRVYSNTSSGLKPVLFKIIGGEDIIEGTGLDELYQLPYNTPSDHRGVVVTYVFDTPVGLTSEFSTASKAAHTTNTTITAYTSNTTTTTSTTAGTKRSRPTSSAIPSHAEVIALDDSDDETTDVCNIKVESGHGGSDASGANKRVKSSEIAGGDGDGEAVLSARGRRDLFLQALEKRSKA